MGRISIRSRLSGSNGNLHICIDNLVCDISKPKRKYRVGIFFQVVFYVAPNTCMALWDGGSIKSLCKGH